MAFAEFRSYNILYTRTNRLTKYLLILLSSQIHSGCFTFVRSYMLRHLLTLRVHNHTIGNLCAGHYLLRSIVEIQMQQNKNILS